MWQVAVFDRDQHQQFTVSTARFALARDGVDGRWQVADERDAPASTAIRVTLDCDALRLDDRGGHRHVELANGTSFWLGTVVELPVPTLFRFDEAWFQIYAADDGPAMGLELLHRAEDKSARRGQSNWGPDAETVARWLAAVGEIHQTAANSPTFFAEAARVALESTGLDAAMVLTRESEAWHIAGSVVPQPQYGIAYDAGALELLREQPEVWRCPARPECLDADVARWRQSVVMAPVLNSQGELIGAVYGQRHGRGDNRRRGIRPLEARVVELLADAVGAGMARRAQEVEAARQQILLEQAFSPPVVDYLRRRPAALAGSTRLVTLLFADVRGFTAVAEKLAPVDAYELLGDVMEQLTQAVMDHGGVVIDYYGDGLSALWNAPVEQPDHADLAVTAAMHMLDVMPVVGERWRERIARPLELGIGLHAGDVQVGNAGTRRRLKYGPRGSAVNIASRVQAATRQIDVPLLITDAVRRRLSGQFVSLKTCTARLPGLEQPFDLYAVFPATDGDRLQGDLAEYAVALAAFESGDLDEAERVLAALLDNGPATPAAFLAQQAAALRQSALGRRATDVTGCVDESIIEILAK
jgi:adenylate cyclase